MNTYDVELKYDKCSSRAGTIEANSAVEAVKLLDNHLGCTLVSIKVRKVKDTVEEYTGEFEYVRVQRRIKDPEDRLNLSERVARLEDRVEAHIA